MGNGRWHRRILVAGIVAAGAAAGAVGVGAAAGTDPKQPLLPTSCEKGVVRDLQPGAYVAPPDEQMPLYYPPELVATWEAAAAEHDGKYGDGIYTQEELGPEWEERAVAISQEFYALCEWEEPNGETGREIILKTWPLPWTAEGA